jgi:hypothetical protein
MRDIPRKGTIMHGPATRVVLPATFPVGSWVVREALESPVLATERTQSAAIEAARADLAGNGGGRVVVFGRDGIEKRQLIVHAGTVTHADAAEPLSAMDVLDAAGAAGARARGEAFDRDGDGEPDGDEPLNRLVELGPDGPAKTAIGHANRMLTWLMAGLAVFPVLPAWLMSSDLGGGFVGIFLGTLAWSLGVAIIAYALIAHPTAWSAGGLALLGVGAFWISNALAGAFGGAVLTTAAPLPTEPGLAGVVEWIGVIGASAYANYGFIGFVLGSILGGFVGWRAAELYKLSNS